MHEEAAHVSITRTVAVVEDFGRFNGGAGFAGTMVEQGISRDWRVSKAVQDHTVVTAEIGSLPDK